MVGFFSSYNGELRDRIVGPQGGPVSTRISRAPYGFLCNRCRGQGPHLELRPEPQGSSPVLTWISGFLWSFNSGASPRLAQTWCQTCKCNLLSSKKSSVMLPVELTKGSVAFSRGTTGLSHMPSCFESILGVIIESMQGSWCIWSGLGYWGLL